MKIELKTGQAVLLPKAGKSFDPTRIPKAVKDAGFSPGEIDLTAVGILTRKDNSLQLAMPGLVKALVLAGGAKEDELAARRDLLGQRLEVKGRLHPLHADRPPGLTVEQWSVAGGEEGVMTGKGF